MVEKVHRVTGYDVDWPGKGEPGNVDLSFRGKRKGDYRLVWNIYSAGGKKPLLGGG